jgi:ribosomal protein L23
MGFLRKVKEAGDGTAHIWQARADATRERIEEAVEQLYGLEQSAIDNIRMAQCNTSTQ